MYKIEDIINKVHNADCLLAMKEIPDKSIDMILCDLPYGTTACKWDTIIPFEPLWDQYKRIIKDNGAIVLTASQPFTSALVMSNIKDFRYELIWDKKRSSGFALANKMPLKTHENILIFYKKLPTYNPQKWLSTPYNKEKYNKLNNSQITGDKIFKQNKKNNGLRFPVSVNYFSQNWTRQQQIHPTQKPVALFEYLIKTYTNEGDLVLDNCAGSGTLGIAAINTKRNYILIEKELKYCKIAEKRLKEIQPTCKYKATEPSPRKRRINVAFGAMFIKI